MIPAVISPSYLPAHPSTAGSLPARRRSNPALFAYPAIGGVITVASGFVASAFAAIAAALVVEYASPHQPANAYANAHFSDARLTSNPLLLAACCTLIAAAAGGAHHRKGLAVLLLCMAALIPWIPAMTFLHHVWVLAPAANK